MKVKKIKQFFFKKNKLSFTVVIVVIVTCLLFVGGLTFYKYFIKQPEYVYVKIRVGQGYWWAQTLRPSIWMIDALKKGEKSYDFSGKPNAEVESVKYYPIGGGYAYDLYITAKLRVQYNQKTKQYSFDRSNINIGSPITIDLPNVDVTGTVIQLQKHPIQKRMKEITLTLVNQAGYSKDSPYKYNSIKIGNSYFDGENTTLTILEKSLEKSIWTVQNNFTGDIYERDVYTSQNIVVKAKILVEERKKGYFYGEEQRVQLNYYLSLGTEDLFLEGFYIRKIE